MFSLVASIFSPNWRLSRYFDLEFGFKSFFLSASNPSFFKSDKRKTLILETKVWDKMPTERETYYLSYLAVFIDCTADESLWDIFSLINLLEFIYTIIASVSFTRRRRNLLSRKQKCSLKTGFAKEADLKRRFIVTEFSFLTWFTPISDGLMEISEINEYLLSHTIEQRSRVIALCNKPNCLRAKELTIN